MWLVCVVYPSHVLRVRLPSGCESQRSCALVAGDPTWRWGNLFSFVGVDAAMEAMYATSTYFFHMVRCRQWHTLYCNSAGQRAQGPWQRSRHTTRAWLLGSNVVDFNDCWRLQRLLENSKHVPCSACRLTALHARAVHAGVVQRAGPGAHVLAAAVGGAARGGARLPAAAGGRARDPGPPRHVLHGVRAAGRAADLAHVRCAARCRQGLLSRRSWDPCGCLRPSECCPPQAHKPSACIDPAWVSGC